MKRILFVLLAVLEGLVGLFFALCVLHELSTAAGIVRNGNFRLLLVLGTAFGFVACLGLALYFGRQSLALFRRHLTAQTY